MKPTRPSAPAKRAERTRGFPSGCSPRGRASWATPAADLEAILVRGSRRMAAGGQKILSAALLRELVKDFQPPSYPLELEYQRLIAAFECTSRQLLPPDLATVPPEAIGARLAELRAALGKSA